MKIHRIEGKLPTGATLCVYAHVPPSSKGMFGNMFDTEQLVSSISRYISNTPLTFTLDVPEGAEQETAKVLRAMADELTGGKS